MISFPGAARQEKRSSKVRTSREDTTLNASSTIAFLSEVEAAYPHARNVHVFCDNARGLEKNNLNDSD